MLQNIEGAQDFYPFTARQLPMGDHVTILDLGCGTGLELEWYFQLNPTAQVTGIDLSRGMLDVLRAKFSEKQLRLICGSYFDVPLGNGYDGAVSVESLHHFTRGEKMALYAKLHGALKKGGYFILTDYFAFDDANEAHWRAELLRLKAADGIADEEVYHYDTPLTVEHEVEALTAGGFSKVEILRNWGATYTLKATKE